MSTEKPEVSRGNYLIKGGAVITVDPALGTFPKADVLVRNGAIAGVGPDLTAEGAEVIDASRHDRHAGLDRFPLSHVEHDRSQLPV